MWKERTKTPTRIGFKCTYVDWVNNKQNKQSQIQTNNNTNIHIATTCIFIIDYISSTSAAVLGT